MTLCHFSGYLGCNLNGSGRDHGSLGQDFNRDIDPIRSLNRDHWSHRKCSGLHRCGFGFKQKDNDTYSRDENENRSDEANQFSDHDAEFSPEVWS